MFFSVLGAWGLWKQNFAIWKNKSGRSVSISHFSFSLGYFLSGFTWGLEKNSLALILHCGGRAFFHVPILVGLWKFKGFTRSEKILSGLFLAGIFVTILMSVKEASFLIYSIGSILAYFTQPVEIFRNKYAGTVEPGLHWIYFGNGTFWTIYGFATNDPVLEWTVPPNVVIALVTIALCYKYGGHDNQTLPGIPN
ncbi:MAG: hypothetical protein HYZ69_02595 [Candidatus Colwellbacteria bacterium]|nr:hypothetical protein [Candidatus Colwellbacteria bacterium]